jgi:hypothetical protein
VAPIVNPKTKPLQPLLGYKKRIQLKSRFSVDEETKFKSNKLKPVTSEAHFHRPSGKADSISSKDKKKGLRKRVNSYNN